MFEAGAPRGGRGPGVREGLQEGKRRLRGTLCYLKPRSGHGCFWKPWHPCRGLMAIAEVVIDMTQRFLEVTSGERRGLENRGSVWRGDSGSMAAWGFRLHPACGGPALGSTVWPDSASEETRSGPVLSNRGMKTPSGECFHWTGPDTELCALIIRLCNDASFHLCWYFYRAIKNDT